MGNGGNININTGSLTVSDGAEVTASIRGNGDGGDLQVKAQHVELIGAATDQLGTGLFTTLYPGATGNAGNLTVETDSLVVRDGAFVSAVTGGNGNGGDLRVKAQQVELIGTLANGGPPSALVTAVLPGGTGNAGNVTVETDSLVVRDGAQVAASTLGNGDAGDLQVKAQQVELIGTTPDNRASSGLFSTVNPGAMGNAGNVTVETDKLVVQDGAAVSAVTGGNGNGGDLQVKAQDVELTGPGSALITLVTPEGRGKAGNLTVETGGLVMRDGAEVSTSTLGNGDGGNLQVKAQQIELIGRTPDGLFGSGLFSTVNPGATGKAGNLTVETGSLVVSNGAQVSATTAGNGNAGELRVKAQDVELIGGSSTNAQVGNGSSSSGADRANAQIGSGLFSSVAVGGTGNGGNLSVDTDHLTVANGAQIFSGSSGSGRAGDIGIHTQSLELRDRGSIQASTQAGNGGNIALDVGDLLLLRNNSIISTTAGIAGAGGDGGNITINTLFIVAVPKEDSDIRANAYTSKGGNIQITAQGIFGIQFRPQDTPLSDITASSTFGLQGTVNLNTSSIDPSRGLSELPATPTDASTRIAAGCPAERGARFVVTGWGGLPEDPRQALRGQVVMQDLRGGGREMGRWGDGEMGRGGDGGNLPITNIQSSLVEAQGWLINQQGNVELVANSSQTSRSSWQGGINCNDLKRDGK